MRTSWPHPCWISFYFWFPIKNWLHGRLKFHNQSTKKSKEHYLNEIQNLVMLMSYLHFLFSFLTPNFESEALSYMSCLLISWHKPYFFISPSAHTNYFPVFFEIWSSSYSYCGLYRTLTKVRINSQIWTFNFMFVNSVFYLNTDRY